MFYVYVLLSKTDDKLYVGYSKDLKQRVLEHNNGKVESTRPRLPMKLVYYESYLSKEDAIHRESMLKRFSGSTVHLRKRIKNSILSK